MKNLVQREGNIIRATAPYVLLSGAGALIGTMFGVATADIANGAIGEFQVEGVLDLAKATAQTWAEGAAIYWDNAAKNCTTTVGANTKIGVAVLNSTNTMAQSADVIGRVRLNSSF